MRVNTAYILLLLSLASPLALAEADESELLNLFTDRQQRAQIDAMRSGNVNEKGVRKTSRISVDGYMTRSDGKSVVWVNDGNTIESQRIDDLRVHPSSVGRNSKVTISVDGKTATLKPGETWLKETGKIVDDY